MALNHSVAQFLADCRQRTDNEGASALDRFPDLELIGYLNRAVWAFWRIMVESRAGNFKVSTTTVTTSSGTSLYALSASFYRLLQVNASVDGRKEWLTSFDENERAVLSDSSAGWEGKPFRYSLVGSNIEFLPTPKAAYDIEVRFVPDPPTLVAGNSFDCVSGDGVNFIVDSMSKFVSDKDENFELSATLAASISELRTALMASLPNRDQNFPPRIQDVRGMRNLRWGRNIRWGR